MIQNNLNRRKETKLEHRFIWKEFKILIGEVNNAKIFIKHKF